MHAKKLVAKRLSSVSIHNGRMGMPGVVQHSVWDATWWGSMDSIRRLEAAEFGAGDAIGPDGADVICGRVKWFDAVKGYGFLVPDAGGADILLHYNLLAEHGRKSLPVGARLVAQVVDGPRGRQARALLEVEAPEEERPRPRPQPAGPRLDPLDFLAEAGDFEQVEVRWFNRAKGYGFLLRSDGVTQVFIHMETVRRAGLATLLPGQICAARVHDGPRGALAVELAAEAGGDSGRAGTTGGDAGRAGTTGGDAG